MKFLRNIAETFVLFVLASLVFGIETPPVYGSELLSIAASASIYSIVAIAIALPAVAAAAAAGGMSGALLSDSNSSVKLGGCAGVLLVAPAVWAIEVAFLRYGHTVLDFFPHFGWIHAATIVALGVLLSITQSINQLEGSE